MTKIRVIIFILTLVLVISIAYIASLYARGYRFNGDTFNFSPSGLLVLKSNPDGAQVFINGELKTATNANISLPPDTYDLEIRKEGFHTWNKRIIIEKEIVTEADANLFKTTPSLSALTFTSSINPVASSDFTKIVYSVPATSDNLNQDKEGLWLMETVNLPLGFARDPKRITDGDLEGSTWQWSPDSRQILLTTKTGVYLLDSGVFTPQNQRINISTKVKDALDAWEKEKQTRFTAQLRSLPDQLKELLSEKTKSVEFSPDETKVLYIAKEGFKLPSELVRPVPGASTQKQERDIITGRTYVYDIKEDRNFLILSQSDFLSLGADIDDGTKTRISWLPTSRHLIFAEEGKITIMDLDGTNKQEVYTGSYVAPFAYPAINSERLLILTNLGANNSLPNLYSLSLK